MTTQFVGLKEFRQNIASYHAKAKKNGWRYIVLNHNKPIWEVKLNSLLHARSVTHLNRFRLTLEKGNGVQSVWVILNWT